MTATAFFVQQTASQLSPILRELPRWLGLAALLLVFRPLLVGLLRAAILVVRPRATRDEQRRRGQMRDRQLVQRMINASSGPSHAAELQAMAARD